MILQQQAFQKLVQILKQKENQEKQEAQRATYRAPEYNVPPF